MARRTVGRAVVRAPKRPTFWEGATGEFSIATGTVSMAVIVSEATLENVPEPTLIRIHGEVFVNVTARTAANDVAVIAMGMILQSAAAIAAGVGSMPLPSSDIGSSWIWHRQVVMRSNIAPANGTDIGGNARILIDNKAMRKVNNNQGLVMIVQNVAGIGTITASITLASRILFKR